MQSLDSLAVLVTGLAVLSVALPRFRHTSMLRWLTLAAALLVVAQLVVEGYRWQMVPVYGLIVALTVLALRPSALRTGAVRWSGAALGASTIAATVSFSAVFPVFELPAPAGPHAVGTTERVLVDTSRPERHTDAPDDRRRLRVRIWYPAQAAAGHERAPYWTHAALRSRALGQLVGLPDFVFSHLDRVQTHSYLDSPLAGERERYPVLVFSHGLFAGFAEQNTALMQALASHGYVVFSLEHAYWGLPSVFPDGTATAPDAPLAAYRAALAANDTPEAQAISVQLQADVPADDVVSLFERYLSATPHESAFYAEALRLWSDDQRFVLDELNALQHGNGLLAGRLDLEHIGMMGMSFGGAVAVKTCAQDDRCRAGWVADGFDASLLRLEPLDAPFLYMDSGEHVLSAAVHRKVADVMHRGTAYIARVEDAEHFDYSDFVLFSPLLFRWVGQLGSIEPGRMLALTNAHALAFFDRHLLGEGGPRPTDGRFPEVTWTAL